MRLEFVDEAGPKSLLCVPPYVAAPELNARKDEPVEAVIVRSGQEAVVINLNIPSPEDAPDGPPRMTRFIPHRENVRSGSSGTECGS